MKRRVATTLALGFALASIATTLSTAFVVWAGHGGQSPLNAADAYICLVDWPMVLLHGSNFYVASGEAFAVNLIGWGLAGLVIGALFSGCRAEADDPHLEESSK